MDLGISGRKAIVCGASQGLGRGVATALAVEGVEILIVARNPERLEATAKAKKTVHRAKKGKRRK